MSFEKQIPVGTVCAMFDLNPNTVRTWERRYQFPSPVRGAGGHRTYTEADLDLISQIVARMDAGLSPAEAIRQTIEATPVDPSTHDSPDAAASLSQSYREQIEKALEEQDHPQLNLLVQGALQKLGYSEFMESLAFPLLLQLGKNWETRGVGVAVEHTFTHAVSGIIASQSQNLTPAEDAPVVTFACVPNELHQLPLLHLCNLAVKQGLVRPIILTAGLPMDEIIEASRRGGATLIVLSATVVPSSADTRQWVARCINAGWPDRVILAGPGFLRSRVYSEYPVRAAAGNFKQILAVLKTVLRHQV